MARSEVIKTALGQRLRDVRRALGDKSRDAFAQDIGLSAKTVANYERGDTQPDASAIAAYREHFDVDTNWLVTGDGEMFERISLAKELEKATIRAAANELRRVGATDDGFVHLPVFDIHASAGLGLPVGPEVQLGALAFDPVFLRAQGARPTECSVITASGDSMQPAIPDGSLLVVDHSQKEIRNGHIMVINVGEDLLVKRVRRRTDGLIDLISDNPAYAPETLGPDSMRQLRVVGRVVYFCRVP